MTSAAATPHREQLSVVTVGHVDHGKSTLLGRLLADSGALPLGKLDALRAYCERNSKPFEYAFVLDALKDEQSQGITIDVARVFFRAKDRDFILSDAPGHIEFLKNMVTGAARADAALLVIDAHEGVQENSRRHGYLLSFLGIRQVAVLINKMDLVDNDERVYHQLVDEFGKFLRDLKVEPSSFLPVSGLTGNNVVTRTAALAWFAGPTLLELMGRFRPYQPPIDQPFRMPVQDVYKFTSGGDDRRIVVGTVESGTVRPGDVVAFYPSGKRSVVKSLEAFNTPAPVAATAGQSMGMTLTEQIYVTRGEIAVRAQEPPPLTAARVRARIFWLGREPLVTGKDYVCRLATSRTEARVETIERVIDAASPGPPLAKDHADRHDVAECVMHFSRPLAFDNLGLIPSLARFVLVDRYEIQGGGLIAEALPDQTDAVRQQVLLRNFKWNRSAVSADRRAEKYNQRACLILVTGAAESRRKQVGRALELRLFEDGKIVYFLAIGNVKYGVDADLLDKRGGDSSPEHLRRLAEVAHILLDVGVILIVSARELGLTDTEMIRSALDGADMVTVWLGETLTTDCRADLSIPTSTADDEAARDIKHCLRERGIIFKPV